MMWIIHTFGFKGQQQRNNEASMNSSAKTSSDIMPLNYTLYVYASNEVLLRAGTYRFAKPSDWRQPQEWEAM